LLDACQADTLSAKLFQINRINHLRAVFGASDISSDIYRVATPSDWWLLSTVGDPYNSIVDVFPFDFGFLKNRYDYELHRKEQLTAALTLPVGVLTVLAGALVGMARSFTYRESVLVVLFGSFVAFAAVAFLTCLVFLTRAYHRQTYSFLPLLADIDRARNEFLEYADAMAGGEADVLEAFEHQMRGRMIEAADQNTLMNDERSALLHRARVALYAVLLLVALAGVPYLIDQARF